MFSFRKLYYVMVISAAVLAFVFIDRISGSGVIPAAYNLVQNAGSNLTRRSTINFTGSGVSAADSGGVTTVTITGAAVGTVTTTGSPASGNLTKFSGASSITNGDLSGDVTTSGTLTTTVAKVNGVAYSSGPSTHTTPVITASNTATYKTLPDCIDTGGNHLNYTQSSDTYSCGTSGGGSSADPATKSVFIATDESTTSTTFASLTTPDSVTFTCAATCTVAVWYSANTYTTTGVIQVAIWDSVFVDSVQADDGNQVYVTSSSIASVPLSFAAVWRAAGLASGSHTIEVRHKVSSATTGHWRDRMITVMASQ